MKLIKKWKRPALIDSYLQSTNEPRLHLGAGGALLDGWLNSDLDPVEHEIFLDTRDNFPLHDRSFDYIFSEHHIEQHTYKDAQKMLKECFRVLKPGGVLRIHTSDIKAIMSLLDDEKSDVKEQYIQFIVGSLFQSMTPAEGLFIVNNAFNNTIRDFGHKFLFNRSVLKKSLSDAGFLNIKEYSLNISDHTALSDIAQHPKILNRISSDISGQELNEFEAMAFEATRPI